MNGDRRLDPRRRVLLRGLLKWPGAASEAVTADVSAGGAFVTVTGPLPRPGARVVFCVARGEGESSVRLLGRVTRVAGRGKGALLGVALQWLGAESEADPLTLGRFLEVVFGRPVKCQCDAGVSTWGLDLAVTVSSTEPDAPEVSFAAADVEITGRRSISFGPIPNR